MIASGLDKAEPLMVGKVLEILNLNLSHRSGGVSGLFHLKLEELYCLVCFSEVDLLLEEL